MEAGKGFQQGETLPALCCGGQAGRARPGGRKADRAQSWSIKEDRQGGGGTQEGCQAVDEP